MNALRILRLRRAGYTIPVIAEATGYTESEIWSALNRCEHTLPKHEPTEEEIYAEAEKLREKSPRYPVGQSPRGVEVTRSSPASMDGRRVKGLHG